MPKGTHAFLVITRTRHPTVGVQKDIAIKLSPFWLLIFDELAGGRIEDLTELFPSTPSTDFVSESQPLGGGFLFPSGC